MSMSRYEEYKNSGIPWVGNVPAHWNVHPLVRVAIERSESNAGMQENNLLSLSYGQIVRKNIDSNDGLLPESFDTYQIVHEGDIVLRLTDLQNDKRSLRSARVRERGIITSAYLALQPTGANSAFLSYLLRAYDLTKVFYSMGGGLRQSMKFADLKRMPIAVPPASEQANIASFLDSETAKIEALIMEQDKLIDLLAEKRQAIISHAVTKGLNPDAPMKDSGVASVGTVPAHWEVGALKRYWSVTDCKHITAEFVEDGYPLAGIREVQSRFVSLETAKRTTRHFYAQLIEGGRKPLPGDLIFSRNATVGEVAQVDELHPAFAMGQDVCLLRRLCESSSSDFMQAVIRSSIVAEQLKNIMVGSTFKRVNVEEIRCLQVPVPPPNEQAKIAAFIINEINRLDLLRAEAMRAVSLLNERRSALIAAAVTGQINVRTAVPHSAAEGRELIAA